MAAETGSESRASVARACVCVSLGSWLGASVDSLAMANISHSHQRRRFPIQDPRSLRSCCWDLRCREALVFVGRADSCENQERIETICRISYHICLSTLASLPVLGRIHGARACLHVCVCAFGYGTNLWEFCCATEWTCFRQMSNV